MEKVKIHQEVIQGFEIGQMALDLHYLTDSKAAQPIVVFVHGFKGFKDWGAFNYIANQMAAQGLAWCKFNFSRNGVSVAQPTEFVNPEAFGNNNYTIELAEIGLILDWVAKNASLYNINANHLFLVGHSRGATMSIIKAVEDDRVKGVVAWAPFFDMKARFRPETIKKWEKEGVWWIAHKRTGQQLPLYPQFYEDFAINQHRFDMAEVCANYEKPLLMLHAKDDAAVEVSESQSFYKHISHAILIETETGGHTFGVSHPFNEEGIVPEELIAIMENTFEFLEDISPDQPIGGLTF